MKPHYIAFINILSAWLYLLSFNAVAQPIDVNKIDALIQKNIGNIGQCNFTLIKNGSSLYENSFTSSNERILSSSRIKISTSSIWLATAAILAVLEQNNISIETDLNKILPQFKGDKGKITIRQLLSHTSGFPTNSSFLKNRSITLAQSVDSIAKYVALTNSPGKNFTYGGVSIQVAARIAEVISKKSWEQLFYELIAKPCQMNVTDFGKAKSVIIGEGAYSSGKDYTNFLKMILNKGTYNGIKVLNEKTVNEMLTDQTGGLPLGYVPYLYKTLQNSRFYGLGVWIERIDPKTKHGTEVNCQGAKGFTPWINTCKKTLGVFAVNGDLRSVQSTVDDILILLDDSFKDNCNDKATEDLEDLETVSGRIKDIVSNPSSQTINIAFQLEKGAMVSLKLFNSLGNEISQILNKQLPSGEHSFSFKTNEIPAGIYFYQLKVNDKLETKKVTISKK